MKKILFIVISILSNYSFSQESLDKIFYLDSLKNESTINNFTIKRIIKDFNSDRSLYKVLEYDTSGNLKLEGSYSDKYSPKMEGEFVEYYKDGSKKS